MRSYDYKKLSRVSIDMEIVNLISKIHEYKGRQELYLETQPQTLDKLREISMIQSTDASNRLEGIYTTNKRLKDLVMSKVEPNSRNEQEIAGYRDVLTLVHENYEYIKLTRNDILSLHNRMYSYYPNNNKGSYKKIDNIILEKNVNGEKRVRFVPVSPMLVEQNMDDLYSALNNVMLDSTIDPLLYIPCFILDFLCIHPFNDGNGRMSRILLLLLMYKSGYIVGRYISFEMIVEKTKQSYYDTLHTSSTGWHENENDYLPFTKYLLSIILKAYEDFDERHKMLFVEVGTSTDRIHKLFENSFEPLSKSDLLLLCPDISQKTMERVLNKLKNDGKIQMIGSGKNTKYLRK